MRLFIAVLLCGGVLSALSAYGQTFPYKTYVIADDVYLRSGPGQNYYPTNKLKRGQEIEVYRHDPGGWCAIRPVEGSFTWVSGRYLKLTEKNLAVITEDGVAARVGSRFSDVRDVVQVRLQKGETVEILEPPARGAGFNDNAWFKIAPPSGEFRWVSAKYLSTEYPSDGVGRRSGTHSPTRPDGDSVDASAGAPPPRDAGLGDAAMADDSLRGRSARSRAITSEEFQAELDRVDLELSVMIIEPPATWAFDSMRERANVLLDQAQTAVERGRARVLANKIARFDDIKQRQDAVLAMRDQTDRSSRVLARLRPRDADTNSVAGDDHRRAATLEVDGRFDGVGQLTQVVSPKVGSPRYALVDRSGSVRCYVTPAPGVNLQNYVGRQVGINGTRGYMPEQRAGHIMARHVTPLESPSGTMIR
jgi:SH3-like domain-containing protein